MQMQIDPLQSNRKSARCAKWYIKVNKFWEGHKISRNHTLTFDATG